MLCQEEYSIKVSLHYVTRANDIIVFDIWKSYNFFFITNHFFSFRRALNQSRIVFQDVFGVGEDAVVHGLGGVGWEGVKRRREVDQTIRFRFGLVVSAKKIGAKKFNNLKKK